MKKNLIAGAAALTLATSVAVSLPQIAQAEALGSSNVSAALSTSSTADGPDGRRQEAPGPDAAALAEKLELSETTVADAISAVRDQMDPAERPSEDATEAEREAAREAQQAAFAKALAAELGIDEAAVADALAELQEERAAERTAAAEAALDQAVADGDLTQSEADAVKKAIEAGIVVIRGGGSGPR
jgi:biotin operon repressor